MQKYLSLGLFMIIIPLVFQSCSSVEVMQGKETPSYLEGEKKVFFKVTYKNTKVGEEDEEKFVRDKVKEKNEDEEGSGDEWKEDWTSNKGEFYHPTFKSQLEEYFEDAGTEISLTDSKKEANYMIRVNVDRMETGFYGGVVHSPAVLDTRMFIKKIGSDEPETVLMVEGAQSGEKMTTKNRLMSAYRNSAMHYGRWFREKLEN